LRELDDRIEKTISHADEIVKYGFTRYGILDIIKGAGRFWNERGGAA